MRTVRLALVVGLFAVAALSGAACSGPRHYVIPVDSALLPWQPPEAAEGEAAPAEAPAATPEQPGQK
jgi:hypothetical protein